MEPFRSWSGWLECRAKPGQSARHTLRAYSRKGMSCEGRLRITCGTESTNCGPSLRGVYYRILDFFHGNKVPSGFARLTHVHPDRRKIGHGRKEKVRYRGVGSIPMTVLSRATPSNRTIEQALFDTEVASMIYGTKAGLSQRALAKEIGTTASVICRLDRSRAGQAR